MCTPGTPACDRCPLSALCQGRAALRADELPVLPAKKPRRVEERRVLLMICGDKTAVRRRPDKGLLAGLWELPNDRSPEAPEGGEECGEAVHVFSHVEWHMTVWKAECRAENPVFTWATIQELETVFTLPSAFKGFC